MPSELEPGKIIPRSNARMVGTKEPDAQAMRQDVEVRLLTLQGASYLLSLPMLPPMVEIITATGPRMFQRVITRDDSGRHVFEELHPEMPVLLAGERSDRATDRH